MVRRSSRSPAYGESFADLESMLDRLWIRGRRLETLRDETDARLKDAYHVPKSAASIAWTRASGMSRLQSDRSRGYLVGGPSTERIARQCPHLLKITHFWRTLAPRRLSLVQGRLIGCVLRGSIQGRVLPRCSALRNMVVGFSVPPPKFVIFSDNIEVTRWCLKRTFRRQMDRSR